MYVTLQRSHIKRVVLGGHKFYSLYTPNKVWMTANFLMAPLSGPFRSKPGPRTVLVRGGAVTCRNAGMIPANTTNTISLADSIPFFIRSYVHSFISRKNSRETIQRNHFRATEKSRPIFFMSVHCFTSSIKLALLRK